MYSNNAHLQANPFTDPNNDTVMDSINAHSIDYSESEERRNFPPRAGETLAEQFRRVSKEMSPSQIGIVKIRWAFGTRTFVPHNFNPAFLNGRISAVKLKKILSKFVKDKEIHAMEQSCFRMFYETILWTVFFLISSVIFFILASFSSGSDGEGLFWISAAIAAVIVGPFYCCFKLYPWKLSEERIRNRAPLLNTVLM